ncbi:uncharacterized protein TNIN_277131 [Trichonephila inaurata madagascariensis]|uniref:Uncharacterized protein n=1 Tax=Trichonephila inaurata madagascariensis TaxID=2747483 RepID=A0A8X7BQK9_9ARAC|nr:uncharacterized protein TNIN_277131 [Trichonephila inaurata madagascariensis]
MLEKFRKANIRFMSLLYGAHMPVLFHLPGGPVGVHGPSQTQSKAQTDWKAIDLGLPQYVILPYAGVGVPLPPLWDRGKGVVVYESRALVGI